MIKIGMIIGDRYEILEKIGTGGMSDVYKAKCHKLNRYVAVKVLKQEFSENANFVSKFRVEAQAAAGLMHPNIVNVYDVGEENGIYYIVMELVEGITLKQYIEKKARLSVKEAVSIAIQISMGIEAAHNNHIIHRDIKPQNIIISKEGKVKVTDFGIAKAATSNTITSNVMGSVHYTSPEQARGGYSDEKSDIYSLGITLFEMLTGRVPFNGETTVAIAIKHIQEPISSPREYISEIPVSVEQIVFKCCQKSPDRRYQSMGKLIADLKQSLISPDEDFVKIVNPSEEASTRMITDKDMVQIKKQSDRRDSMEEELRLNKKSHRVYKEEEDEEVEEEEDIDDVEEDDEEEDGDEDSKVERITTILAVVAAVLIGCIVLFLVGKTLGILPFGGSDKQGETVDAGKVEMPKVVGRQIEEVKTELLGLGLSPEITYKEATEYDAGLVLECNIGVGQMVDTSTEIILTVNSGTSGVEVPNIVGKSTAEAVANLEGKGFSVNRTESYDAQVPKGNIISQTPEGGTKAPSGSAVTIRISQGAEDNKIRVPNLIGVSEMDAMATLTEAGLKVGSVSEVNNEDAALTGLVCYQSYSVGSYVDSQTAIDLRVSIGPKLATYSYNGSIQAPTPEEDPQYKDGLNVTVTVDTADGIQLLNTNTASFPISVNYTGIKAATGTITFTYTVTTDAQTVTDPDTGETTTIEGVSEQRTISREIQFTPES
ncbi:Stk1 family PASTA domain-containing Ser/Thr kinase [Kineothrix sp. MB12-C1]|uniref:Stk1 family PASTA domain-containing Ser/Thr kinase n=1 Tax=Kineothrix sp. MB12-C1 TaxID=3070215 RepID=UPI0027D2685E|nr:Stk1 family PASTA domain-containing Ser/Thr kinase [Kineothrix sp. MB12-C1]WMC92219.1 Stk1 family PASTA domain-containing Ser/Thr kinase [Kineothrix sp. MB12-C1]